MYVCTVTYMLLYMYCAHMYVHTYSTWPVRYAVLLYVCTVHICMLYIHTVCTVHGRYVMRYVRYYNRTILIMSMHCIELSM
jgi:hypothetical protein